MSIGATKLPRKEITNIDIGKKLFHFGVIIKYTVAKKITTISKYTKVCSLKTEKNATMIMYEKSAIL
ncbi:hypothetical protein KAM353_38040 [Aeromonas caviae]|uniref:Uncharacterized protein n=1 Tax=Aeromonas caviae TaxID=648 RepID=A0AA37CVV9_AERCA|nr:hypothetical protein KAM336_17840 [Aeromonas caviae]GJA27421.1 hypothetical protein KAM340_15880 [Aeromonas caviae]GJA63045.1 hypothetical protein KAM351_16560 [Aeromonas caviae]GJA74157.1 hypothetical protein KAM353_38040 [Aeromonas caviae]